ncbi:sensor histidine kinase [Brevibacillus choshinensis]|uniref:histidine kinase n=1 Tax=Brevibacillus choshinensis TaxID=54911 RepID=A0ABX7FPB2_BRECH|nr:ATP-binding protein [Brevibacillus choshinensis]QRG68071.1 HAMP domain-containing protein [Brevibacillus choshinensis]
MKGIRTRLIVYFGLILLLIVLVLEGLFYWAVHTYYFGTATEALVTRSTTFTNFINKYATGYRLKDKARYILENASNEEYAKIEVLDTSGKVILNSYGFQTGEVIQTPDVLDALKGMTGIHVGKSPMTRERVIAVSTPLTFETEYSGVLRYTISAEPLYQAVNQIALYGAGVGAGVVFFAFALSLIIAKRIVDPIEDLTKAATQMATGNFSARAAKRYDDEVGTLAETFNYMAAEIGKNEKLKNDFISSVSHELRTPLTSIKGWSETLISGGLDEPEETMLGLEVISKETDRLISLVEELLDFSKFQSGEMKLSLERMDLREVLDDVHLQFAIRSQDKRVDLQMEIPSSPLAVMGDFNRLMQVFVNLLDNAFKFTPRGGTISVTAAESARRLIISVTDTGEGIDEGDLPHITGKFYKGRSKQSGSGLGLAICKEIIEFHGGRLFVNSILGQGTTITVDLPVAEAMSTPESAEKG